MRRLSPRRHADAVSRGAGRGEAAPGRVGGARVCRLEAVDAGLRYTLAWGLATRCCCGISAATAPTRRVARQRLPCSVTWDQRMIGCHLQPGALIRPGWRWWGTPWAPGAVMTAGSQRTARCGGRGWVAHRRAEGSSRTRRDPSWQGWKPGRGALSANAEGLAGRSRVGVGRRFRCGPGVPV